MAYLPSAFYSRLLGAVKQLPWHKLAHAEKAKLADFQSRYALAFSLHLHKDDQRFVELFQLVSRVLGKLVPEFTWKHAIVSLINDPSNHMEVDVNGNRGPFITFAVGNYEGGKLSFLHADGTRTFDSDGTLIQYDGATQRRVEPLLYNQGYRPTRYAFVVYNVDETKRQRVH